MAEPQPHRKTAQDTEAAATDESEAAIEGGAAGVGALGGAVVGAAAGGPPGAIAGAIVGASLGGATGAGAGEVQHHAHTTPPSADTDAPVDPDESAR